MSEADFTGASLDSAILKDVKALGTNFTRADLCEADLSGANLKAAKFDEAYMIRADLNDVKFDDFTSFVKTDLRVANYDEKLSSLIAKYENYTESPNLSMPELDLDEIKEAVQSGEINSTKNPVFELFSRLLEEHPGVAVGEYHFSNKHRHIIAGLLSDLKKQGLEVIAFEIDNRNTDLVNAYLDSIGTAEESTNEEALRTRLKSWVPPFEDAEAFAESHLALFKAAQLNGIKVLCADSSECLDFDKNTGISPIHAETGAHWCALRQKESEPYIENVIKGSLSSPGKKFITINGLGHVTNDDRRTDPETINTHKRLGIPTIAMYDAGEDSVGIHVDNQERSATAEMSKTLNFRIVS
ncbi:MAG: pentapeptide repeat-containing protein [Candidatus Caenarcaniphilales bacterium]|nr:pentapeptide repeat-containing protein [Candidatus Caenarcaniphilales bacterium]